ncbi:MAG: hybrid sensor histidine kinase/response regulator [Aggregatilineales bacterium]
MTKILLIEDMHDLRDDVLEILKIEGYDVLGAENGIVGLDIAQAEQPDLIVCDITMPELDGYGVLRRIRKMPDVATTPFIFLTARTQRDSRRHGMVLGADDYITKPFEMDELLISIQTQLRRRRELNDAASAHLDALRSNIMTALPHEFRTPLNSVIGFSEMLMMEAQHLKADQVIDWSTRINESGRQLLELVEDYLYYVRLQAADFSPEHLQEFQTAALDSVHFVVQSQAMRIADIVNRPDDLELDVPDISSAIRVQHTDIIKIISELVENAFKFSEKGDIVRVSTKICDGMYEVCIKDSGRGLSRDQIKHIGPYVQFERGFFEQQGIGFGLTLVKRLMELYGGRIEIQPGNPGLIVKVSFVIHEN